MKKVLTFDTSGINCLLDDPDYPNLLVGVKTGFFSRVTATNLEEITATQEPGRKKLLLDVCQQLQSSGEVILPFNQIAADLVIQFDRNPQYDWRSLPIRWLKGEMELRDRVAAYDPDVIRDQLSELKRLEKEFVNIFASPRPKFDEIFENGSERPQDYVTLVRALQISGGAFWKFAADLYEYDTKKPLDEATLRLFVEKFPPFRALLLAICMAQYQFAIRDPKNLGVSYKAGRMDLYSATYLPYCDAFVTGDDRQYNALAEIEQVGKLQTEVLRYADFRERLLPQFNLMFRVAASQ